MVSSLARWAVACILIVLSTATYARSQSAPGKTATATISGKVTIKGKGAPGIVVAATDPNYGGPRSSRYRARTDDSGNYRINLPPDTYQVMPVPLAWVIESQQANLNVVVNDGETIEDFNFALAKGGVITGKITDADGKPLIEESISLTAISTSGNMIYSSSGAAGAQTDDRGVYRIFGLSPGKYKVSVGQSVRGLMGSPGRNYRQTFYPSVTDEAKATIVELTEGSEASGIDIVVGRPLTGFTVKGRVVDGETGKPVPNVTYGISRMSEQGRQFSTSGEISNARGEFRFDNLTPGKYSVFIDGRDNNVLATAVLFDVVDHDIADLVLKTSRGATVSGVVVFEGAEDKPGVNKFEGLYIHAWVPTPEADFMGTASVSLKPDGSFQIGGLRSGVPNFGFASRMRSGKNPVIARIERDGIVQPGGINLKEGEQVTGVRLIAKYLTGAIRGQVVFEGSDVIPASRISVWVQPVDDGRAGGMRMSQNFSSQVDSRGRFVMEGLAAGTYEVNVAVFDAGRYDSTQISKQQVTVVDNAVSEITMTLKPKP